MNFIAASCIFGGSIKRNLIFLLHIRIVLLTYYIYLVKRSWPSFPFGLFQRLTSHKNLLSKNEFFTMGVGVVDFLKKIRQKQKNVLKKWSIHYYFVGSQILNIFFDIFIFQETFYKSAHKVLHAVLKIWNIS